VGAIYHSREGEKGLSLSPAVGIVRAQTEKLAGSDGTDPSPQRESLRMLFIAFFSPSFALFRRWRRDIFSPSISATMPPLEGLNITARRLRARRKRRQAPLASAIGSQLAGGGDASGACLPSLSRARTSSFPPLVGSQRNFRINGRGYPPNPWREDRGFEATRAYERGPSLG